MFFRQYLEMFQFFYFPLFLSVSETLFVQLLWILELPLRPVLFFPVKIRMCAVCALDFKMGPMLVATHQLALSPTSRHHSASERSMEVPQHEHVCLYVQIPQFYLHTACGLLWAPLDPRSALSHAHTGRHKLLSLFFFFFFSFSVSVCLSFSLSLSLSLSQRP